MGSRRRTFRFGIGVAGVALYLLTRGGFRRASRRVLRAVFSPVIYIRRSILVRAPVEEVYEFWSQFENYPKFMSFVEGVEVSENCDLLWRLVGPGGLKTHWHAQLEKLIRNSELAWRTVSGSPLFHSGRVRFYPEAGNSTRLNLELVYCLRAGPFGFTLARLLGLDPRGRIDGDLETMKNILESAAEHGRLGRDQVA